MFVPLLLHSGPVKFIKRDLVVVAAAYAPVAYSKDPCIKQFNAPRYICNFFSYKKFFILSPWVLTLKTEGYLKFHYFTR